MIETLLKNYINFAEKTGWKTFFKAYLIGAAYFFILCWNRPDAYGTCLYSFPFDPFYSFISPLLNLFTLSGLNLFDRNVDAFTALFFLSFSAILINVYRIGKPESAFHRCAKKISLITKMILISYLIIIVILYAYYWISGEPCSPEVCGFLKGYY